ncbi:MAG: hypothetical protein AAF768_04265 [Pseudomonadota bacterium]
MVSSEPLDLAEIDPPRWRIMTDDVVYGPYTLGQMRSFADEDRLRENSKVADGDGGAFIAAWDHDDLKLLFSPSSPPEAKTEPRQPDNHMIFFRHVGESRAAALQMLNQLGKFAEMMPGVYLLSSAERTSQIRLQLAEISAPGDQIVVVNATRGRLAWAGLGDDTDALVQSIWAPKS